MAYLRPLYFDRTDLSNTLRQFKDGQVEQLALILLKKYAQDLIDTSTHVPGEIRTTQATGNYVNIHTMVDRMRLISYRYRLDYDPPSGADQSDPTTPPGYDDFGVTNPAYDPGIELVYQNTNYPFFQYQSNLQAYHTDSQLNERSYVYFDTTKTTGIGATSSLKIAGKQETDIIDTFFGYLVDRLANGYPGAYVIAPNAVGPTLDHEFATFQDMGLVYRDTVYPSGSIMADYHLYVGTDISNEGTEEYFPTRETLNWSLTYDIDSVQYYRVPLKWVEPAGNFDGRLKEVSPAATGDFLTDFLYVILKRNFPKYIFSTSLPTGNQKLMGTLREHTYSNTETTVYPNPMTGNQPEPRTYTRVDKPVTEPQMTIDTTYFILEGLNTP